MQLSRRRAQCRSTRHRFTRPAEMPTPHDGPAACGWYLNPIEQAPAIYRFASSPLLMRSDSSLKRPQEINDVLLLPSSQPIETFDDLVCLAAIALVISNDFHQVGRPSIMEEEDTLSDTPKRSGSELVGAGTTLCDAVGEAFAHMVDEKVRVKIRRLIGKRSVRACRCCAPREYPTLINVSSAIKVSSPGQY